MLAAQGMSQGLVGDPRKFNVAVTRGRALVLVLGHPRFTARTPTGRLSWPPAMPNAAAMVPL